MLARIGLLLFVVSLAAGQACAQRVQGIMTVDLLDRTTISASVDGVIEEVAARAGEPIAKGAPLVRLATERRELELLATRADYEALRKKAENNTEELVNAARERSARFNVDQLREASARFAASVPALEMTRARIELEQAATEKEGARKDQSQFASEAEAKLREAELLEFDLEQSEIASPFDGALVRVDRRPGEFVERGEAIAELYRLDRLSGVMLIDRDEVPPSGAIGLKGSFVVEQGGAERSYAITIARVIPRVDVDGRYRALVEIENEQAANGHWRLLPGIAGRAELAIAKDTVAVVP